MPEVLYWVTRSHKSKDHTMRDWCDGIYCVENRLDNHLLILLNIDDIETCNPIGMCKKTHKLTIVSFELTNIPPQFRSSLHVKQLIAICKSSILKNNGLKNLLLDFIEGMNILRNGHTFRIDGKDLFFKAAIIGTPADTLASNQLWGFKEGVAKAKKCCRTCEAERPDIFEKNFEEDFVLRKTADHLEKCNELEEASPKTRELMSKTYGINNRSPLFYIEGVDLNLAVHDPMHVLLGGIILVEMKAMFYNFICVQNLFQFSG